MVLPKDAEAYEKRVAPATEALEDFYGDLINELADDGGFDWWNGYSDWKTLTLLSDYLIQLVLGSAESMRAASLSAKNHAEMVTSDDFHHKQVWKQGQIFTAHDAVDRRRNVVINQSAESCFFHLGQALDRLAVAVIIVGGWHLNDAIKLDWGTLKSIDDDFARTDANHANGIVTPPASLSAKYEPVGSPARAAQQQLLTAVQDWAPHGPEDWFPWMRDCRNGMTHRAGAKKMVLYTKQNKLSRVFYRQPTWSELQSLVFGARPPHKPFFDAFIQSPSEEVLYGLCDSVAKMIAAAVSAAVICWETRKADPTLIVQHGKQWRLVDPSDDMSNFPGYGTLEPKGDQIHMNPTDSRRWMVARLADDDRRGDWYV